MWPRLHPCLRPVGTCTLPRFGGKSGVRLFEQSDICRRVKALRLRGSTARFVSGVGLIAKAELSLFADHRQLLRTTKGIDSSDPGATHEGL
jgi:hypothetical protein